MAEYRLSDIYIYPVKSLGGIRLEEAVVEEKGLQWDRRWMLTDHAGNFLSQRKTPEMALFRTKLKEEGLEIAHVNRHVAPLLVPFEPKIKEKTVVKVWGDEVEAFKVGVEADQWFGKLLKKNCRLVYMPEETRRKVDPDFAKNGETVSFADGYPFMMIGAGSLENLNAKLETPLPMDRFRPNLVFSGGEAFAEDHWEAFSVENIDFKVIKPCARCVIPSIDQQTAEKGKEPTHTLVKYRRKNNKVLFGQNLLHQGAGKIRVGERLIVKRQNE